LFWFVGKNLLLRICFISYTVHRSYAGGKPLPISSEKTNAKIDVECLALGRYLFNQDVNEYMRDKYSSANAMLGLENAAGRFDRLLVASSVRHPLLAKACDAYSRFFAPQGALRKKMILLLAIAEVSPTIFLSLDATDAGGWFMFFVRSMWKGMGMVLCLLPALPVLLPLQLLLKMTGSRRRKGESHV
jgi:hypothetical protein